MSEQAAFVVRALERRDRDELLAMWRALWPEEVPGEHEGEVDARVAGSAIGTLPLVTFVAESSDGLIGFAEVGLRSHADGCDPARAVAFLEGWFVAAKWRRRGVGAALVRRAEEWGKSQGALEIASDTWFDAQVSEAAHVALGFEVVDRCIHFKKAL
jgi:aminoglycoside 6'-N-acetyltransferase I